LRGFYFSLEEKYYSLMDWFQERGARVYDWFITPVEKSGIPSFPIAALLALLVLGGLSALLLAPSGVPVQVTVSSSNGSPLQGALVTLYYGDESVERITDASGTARFDGLPEGAGASVRVSLEGFELFASEFELVLEEGANVLLKQVTLSPETIEKPKLTVTVANPDGDALSGAVLLFSDPNTGEQVEESTDASGSAFLEFEDGTEIFKLTVRRKGFVEEKKTCFASQGTCFIELKAEQTTPTDEGGKMEATASVLVFVKEPSGEGARARASLFDASTGQLLDERVSGGDGVAFFEGVAVGTRVYVSVSPEDTSYWGYPGFDNVQTILVGGIEFRVNLEEKGVASTRTITIAAADEEGGEIGNAQVMLYSLENPLNLLASAETNDFGLAEMEVAEGTTGYLTVFAQGFLPHLEKSVLAGDTLTVTLEKTVPGNNGVARVLVLDPEGDRVPFARVSLLTSDGFNSGVPDAETLDDGSALFESLPLSEFRAIARKGSASGEGDAFKVSVSEEAESTIWLEPTYAYLKVDAVDATQQPRRNVAVEVEAFLDDEKISSCRTGAGSTNVSCKLKVRANKPVVLKVSDEQYSEFESEPIVLGTGQEAAKTLKLVPASYSDELQIISFELVDAVTLEPVEFIEKGNYYRALLTVSLPSGADSSGFVLRAGGDGGADESQAVLVSWNEPGGAEVVVIKGDAYEPDYSCSDEVADYAEEYKWVQLEFEGGFGVRTLSAKVFVKPSAKGSVSFDYRAFAEKGGYWFRAPEDPDLGSEESVSGRQACRALTEETSFEVVSGSATCNDDACLAIALSTSNQLLSNGLPVEVDHEFAASVQARVFKSVSSPYVKVSAADGQVIFTEVLKNNSSKEVESGEFTVNLALDELGRDFFAVKAIAGIPSDYARLDFVLGDSDGELLRAQRFVTITGKGEFVFAVKPDELRTGQRTDLVATLASKSGAAVEDARVEIVEVEGYSFGSSPNGDYYVLGDGSRDSGEEGKYKFKGLRPSAPGVIEVVASKPGFNDAVVEVAVKAFDWLEFYPDPGSIELDCDGASLRVENLLESEVEVRASFSGTACASLSGPSIKPVGQNDYSFSIKGLGDTQIFLEPTRYGECYLVFNSVLESSGSAFSKTAFIKVSCAELKPEVNASENCSSANCGACNEAQCLNLMEKGDYCYPEYSILPDGNYSFVSCELNKTTAGLEEYECSAEHCALCTEAECLELQAEGECLAQYANYFNGSRVYSSCTQFSAEECEPANFNFASILARRLAQYHANQLFNPSETSSYIASTADNYIVVSPYGLQVSAGGEGCSGTTSLTCTKEISALIPTNGIAFSVKNSFGQDTQIFLKGGTGTCFKLVDLERDRPTLRSLVTNLVDLGSQALMLPANQYRTYALIFDPSEKGCMDFVYESDGRLTLAHSEPWTIELKVSTSGLSSREVKIRFTVKEDESLSELGLILMPLGGEIVYRNPSAREPVLAANNVQTGGEDATFTVSGEGLSNQMVLEPLGWDYAELKAGEDGLVAIKRGVDEVGQAHFEASKAGPDYYIADVVGNPGAVESGLLRCSRTGYCTPTELEDVKQEIERVVNDAYQEFYEGLDKVDEASLVTGTADMFEKALDDAIADYVAAKVTYEACKAIGRDPLEQLKLSCSAELTTVQETGTSFGDIYGDAFQFTTCNSQLFNYLVGSSQQYGPQFWASFKTGLKGMLTPREGTLQHLEPIIDLSDLKVIVPVKVSGETVKSGEAGGIRLLTFQFDPANAFGGGTNDWVLVDQIDGTPWNEVYETSLTGPSKTNIANLFLDAFGYSGTDFPSFTSLPYPFVKESGEMDWDEFSSPNLLTINKYGFDWGKAFDFERDEQSIAGEGKALIKAVATSDPKGKVYLQLKDGRLFYGDEAEPLLKYFLFEGEGAPCLIEFNEDYTEAWCGGAPDAAPEEEREPEQSADFEECLEKVGDDPRKMVECLPYIIGLNFKLCTKTEQCKPSETCASFYDDLQKFCYTPRSLKAGDYCVPLQIKQDEDFPFSSGSESQANLCGPHSTCAWSSRKGDPNEKLFHCINAYQKEANDECLQVRSSDYEGFLKHPGISECRQSYLGCTCLADSSSSTGYSCQWASP